MPAKSPRLSVVVEPELARWLRQRARRRGLSVSLLVRDLLRRAAEEEEAQFWAREGETRLANFDPGAALDAREVWGE
ncbi:MAG: ribbon-helix-helix protein, CopG family [Thermoanaerobaculum sp.]